MEYILIYFNLNFQCCLNQLLNQYFLYTQFFKTQLALLSALHLLMQLIHNLGKHFRYFFLMDLPNLIIKLFGLIEYSMNIPKILDESFSDLNRSILTKLHIFIFLILEVKVSIQLHFQKLHSFQDYKA